MSKLNKYWFHPAFVLGVALVAALLFALFVLLRYPAGDRQWMLLFYFVPISVPFVAYLFDRAEQWQSLTYSQLAIEIPIILLALSRAVVAVPLISGHALFLSYALLTTRSWVAKLTAFVVLGQVAGLKILRWRDVTFIGGVTLGLLAALAFYYYARLPKVKVVAD